MYSINMDWTPGVCQALEISSEFRNPFMVAYVFVVEKTITTVCRMVIRAMEQYNAEKEGKRRGYSIKQDDQRRLWRWAKTERSFEWTMWIIRRSWGNKCNALRVQLCSRNSQEASAAFGKDPEAGKDWGQEEKRVTEDETVGWHRWLNGHEFEQTLGDSEAQGSLAGCSLWDCKESDMT